MSGVFQILSDMNAESRSKVFVFSKSFISWSALYQNPTLQIPFCATQRSLLKSCTSLFPPLSLRYHSLYVRYNNNCAFTEVEHNNQVFVKDN